MTTETPHNHGMYRDANKAGIRLCGTLCRQREVMKAEKYNEIVEVTPSENSTY
ncbi:MAG: hypothetical protein WC581_11350 [Thermodesulfovibrionales bacterium]